MVELTPEKMAEAKQAYENAEPMARIARRLGLHRTQLNRERDKAEKAGRPWVVSPSALSHGASATQRAIINRKNPDKVVDIHSRQTLRTPAQSGEQPPLETPKHLLAQAALAETAMLTTKALFARFLRDIQSADAKARDTGATQVPITKAVAETLALLISSSRASVAMSREIEGRKAGQPSIEPEAAAEDNGLEIIQRRIEPVKVLVDRETGRIIPDATGLPETG
jgi:transposase-like protein